MSDLRKIKLNLICARIFRYVSTFFIFMLFIKELHFDSYRSGFISLVVIAVLVLVTKLIYNSIMAKLFNNLLNIHITTLESKKDFSRMQNKLIAIKLDFCWRLKSEWRIGEWLDLEQVNRGEKSRGAFERLTRRKIEINKDKDL